MPRYLSVLCGFIALFTAAVALGIRSERADGPAARFYSWVQETLRLAWRDAQATSGLPPWALRPAFYEGEGVTRGGDIDDGALILIVGWFPGSQDRARLMHRDGSLVASWDFRGVGLGKEGHVHGISLDSQGSPISANGGPLVKLGHCGEILLRVPGNFHHSVIPAEGGGWWALDSVWIPRWKAPADYLPPHTSEFFRSRTEEDIADVAGPMLQDDTVVRLGPDGEVLQRFSIPKVLYEAGLAATFHRFVLVGDEELTHSNSVHELSSELAPAFPMFEAGDLLLSLLKVHMLAVVDPDTHEIKWHQTGPWAWQHDAWFQPDGTITVFNNGPHGKTEAQQSAWHRYNPTLHSNVLRVDPANGRVEVLAGREISAESHFYTRHRGQHQVLPDGSVLVAEARSGRVVQLGPEGRIIWEFVNRYDEDSVATVANAYLYPAGYFQVDDWSCPPR